MKILVINAYESDNPNGEKGYKYFLSIIKSIFNSSLESENFFIERKYDELSDIIVDWEHEPLRNDAEGNCKRFDRIDFVVIGGDMHLRPWEPQASQVVSLVHMTKYTKKPFLGAGFGAFAGMYSVATKGARFNILNGPNGSSIEELSTFPHYSVSSGAFPSGWLDNETGDIYCYEPSENIWKPVCNIGAHLEAATGKPMSTLLKPHPIYKAAHQDERIIGPSANTIVKELHDDIIYILPAQLNHYLVGGLPSNRKAFNIKIYPNWYLNPTHSLPLHENLVVIGEGSKYGPIICMKDNMLLLTNRMEPYNAMEYMTLMMKTFVEHQINIRNNTSNSVNTAATNNTKSPHLLSNPAISLHMELFGAFHDRYYTHHKQENHLIMAQSLSKQIIPSRCTTGKPPIKVDPPVFELFFRPYQDKEELLYTVQLVKLPKRTTLGRKSKRVVQNPYHARQKRLEQLFSQVGNGIQEQCSGTIAHTRALIEHSLAQSQQGYAENEATPAAMQDLLAGMVMKENNISVRRHHISAEEKYYQTMVKQQQQKRIGTTNTTATNGTDIEDENEDVDVDDGEEEAEAKEEEEVQERKEAGGWKSEITEKLLSLIEEEQQQSSSQDSKSLQHQQQMQQQTTESQSSDFSSMSTLGELGIGSGIQHHKQHPPQQQYHPHPPSRPSFASSSVISTANNTVQRAHAVFDEPTTMTTAATAVVFVNKTAIGSNVITTTSTSGAAVPRLYSPTSSSTTSSTDSLGLPPSSPTDKYTVPVKSILTNKGNTNANKNKKNVKIPEILNWSTVFSHNSTLDQQLIATSSPLVSSQSARCEPTHATSSLIPSKPSQQIPSSARSARSSSSQKQQQLSQSGHRKFTHLVNPRTTHDIVQELQQQALPIHHPKQAIHMNNTTIQKKNLNADDNSSMGGEDDESICSQTTSSTVSDRKKTLLGLNSSSDTTNKIIILPYQATSSSRCNYHQLKQLREAQIIEDAKEYQGMYTVPFLTPQEQELKEEMQSKTKFVGGTFKRYFASNSHYSAMEPGKVGQIGPQGPYPDQPEPGYNPKMTAADWVYLQRPGKESWIAGTWKR